MVGGHLALPLPRKRISQGQFHQHLLLKRLTLKTCAVWEVNQQSKQIYVQDVGHESLSNNLQAELQIAFCYK